MDWNGWYGVKWLLVLWRGTHLFHCFDITICACSTMIFAQCVNLKYKLQQWSLVHGRWQRIHCRPAEGELLLLLLLLFCYCTLALQDAIEIVWNFIAFYIKKRYNRPHLVELCGGDLGLRLLLLLLLLFEAQLLARLVSCTGTQRRPLATMNEARWGGVWSFGNRETMVRRNDYLECKGVQLY